MACCGNCVAGTVNPLLVNLTPFTSINPAYKEHPAKFGKMKKWLKININGWRQVSCLIYRNIRIIKQYIFCNFEINDLLLKNALYIFFYFLLLYPDPINSNWTVYMKYINSIITLSDNHSAAHSPRCFNKILRRIHNVYSKRI